MHVLYNARIFTFDGKQPFASAIVIDGDRVRYVGTDEDAISLVPEDAVKENMDGKFILPGLTDSHVHLEYYAINTTRVNCETNTKEECLKRVQEKANKLPAGTWVFGHGWNQNEWKEGYGSKEELDNAAPDHPVFLTHKSWHASWANSLALEAAGINKDTPDPEGGAIQRDTSGNPTGILFESASKLVEGIAPEPDFDQVQQSIFKAQESLWRMGLTGVHDFDRKRCFSALQALRAEDKLKLRVYKSIPLDALDHAAEIGLSTSFGDNMLWIGPVKIFADGALGPQTAAMNDPYENDPDNLGIILLDEDELFEYGKKAVDNGLALAVHAIGDRANHVVLNSFENIRKYEMANKLPLQRHRIEHVQLLTEDDLGRLSQNRIIASMQPVHTTSDMEAAEEKWGERCKFGYAIKSLLDSRTRLTFGSDAPIEIPNPFHGIYAAVTRRRPDGTPGPEGWYPEQRINIQAAIEGYLTGPAYASGMENHLGRLIPGYFADLILISKNPFSSPAEELRELRSDATMVAGEWVWRS